MDKMMDKDLLADLKRLNEAIEDFLDNQDMDGEGPGDKGLPGEEKRIKSGDALLLVPKDE